MKGLWALSRGVHERRDQTLSWRDQMQVMRRVMPLLWPHGQWTIRLRLAIAFVLVVLGKVVTVLVPMFYKYVVDALTAQPNAIVVVPVALILGYGLMYILSSAIDEMRDLI